MTAEVALGSAMKRVCVIDGLGEVTPAMAEAVAASPAPKLLLPLSQENVAVVGSLPLPLPKLVDELIEMHVRPFIETHA